MNFFIKLKGMRENLIKEKSFDFALKIIKVSKEITIESKEFDLTRQLKRSGTAIGALVRESEHAQSKAENIHKLSISLKEANETEYWIDLLYRAGYMNQNQYDLIRIEAGEINRILIAILKKLKNN